MARDNTCWSCKGEGRFDCTCERGSWICGLCQEGGVEPGSNKGTCRRCGGYGGGKCRRCGGAGWNPCRKCGETGIYPPRPGLVHQIVKEREEAEQRRAASSARRYEEEHRRRAEAKAQMRAEEERRTQVQNQRQTLRQCIMCGRPLGFFDKLTGQLKHGNCHSFKGPGSFGITRSTGPSGYRGGGIG